MLASILAVDGVAGGDGGDGEPVAAVGCIWVKNELKSDFKVSKPLFKSLKPAIKSASPFKYTFVITHCNGASGYLVPAELYKEGGFELRVCPFGIEATDIVVKKALRMLYDL